MRKYLFLLAIVAFFLPHTSHAVFTYYRTITVTSTPTVASGTQNDFPVLFSTTANWLKTSSTDATNGRIQNVNGWDIVFSTSTPSASGSNWDCTKAAHEIERYTSSTGEMIAWFRATTIATSSLYYVCYGDGTITATQEASSSVWDAGYKGVWHLKETATSTAKYILDSTVNLNNGSSSGTLFPTPTSTGQMSGAQSFDGSDAIFLGTALDIPALPLSISAWVNPTNYSNWRTIFSKRDSFTTSTMRFDFLLDKITGNVLLNRAEGTIDEFTFAPATSTWTYLTVVATAADTRLYVNGALQETSGVFSLGTLATALVRIGDTGGNDQFLGRLDEIRISSSTRSAGWILTEYSNQNSPSTFYAIGSETTINPVPTTTSLSPGSASAGGSSFTLTVSGTNFVASSTVEWNGASRSTTFVSSSSLTATINAADIASAGTASVTVVNPSPGGGTSNAQTFTIASPPSTTITGTGGTYPKPSMVMNNGATVTNNPRVRIEFHTPPYVTGIALSRSPQFEGAALLPYASVKDWTLCDASCAPGSYTVYARLYWNASLSYDDIQSVILYAPPSLLSSVEHAASSTTGTPAV
ncbi:MAG: LamG-like jellyroll fold domain-containing protein, partial [Thermoleophilia bacterium]